MNTAVIFDMDGVISDTPKMGAKINRDLFISHGIHLTEEEITKEMAGIPDNESVPKIFARHGIHITDEDLEKLMHTKWEELKKAYKKDSAKIEGSVELIKKLKKASFTLAVASSSREDFVMTVLESLHVDKYFSAIVSMHDVTKGKPAPDIFLLAAKKLGKNPIECVVIEDAPAGVKAANAARMKVIAIASTHKKEELKKANLIIHAYSEITSDTIKNL